MSGARPRLTEGPVGGHLLWMTLPMMWGILSMMTTYLVDTWFVGRLGATELAALGFAFPVVMVVISVGIGLSAGTASVVARALGGHDVARARRLTTDSLLLTALASVVLTVAGIATLDPLFRALGAGEELLALVRDYMVVWYAGLVFMILPMTAMATLRASGDSRLQGILMAAASLLNLVLDPLLIFGLAGFPRLELQGAALASVLSRAFGIPVMLWVMHRRLGVLDTSWPQPREVLASWRAVLRIGAPAAGTNVIIPAAQAAALAIIATSGAHAVAGYGVATRIESVTLVAFFAMSAIIGPVVGQNLGAGLHGRIDEALRLSVRFCLLAGLALALVLGLAAVPLARLFTDQPAVVSATAWYLWLVPVSYGAAGMVMIVNAAFNGLGLPLPAVTISLLRMVIIYLPLAWLASRAFGYQGVFAAYAVTNVLMAAAAWRWIRRTCRGLAAGDGGAAAVLSRPPGTA